jgi:2-C-methyl-D-erythritol 2,4-cyclodiphosphate synthase
MTTRIGIGYDIHRLEHGLPLWLGGVQIAHNKGCAAHSDGDVVIHAICDALLGAAAMGDIGQHFPDTDAQYKGIDSKILLRHVCALLTEKGYRIANVDAMLMLQTPKVKDYIPMMRAALADAMSIGVEQVSVKATTTEHLGCIGREEGAAAQAAVIVERE